MVVFMAALIFGAQIGWIGRPHYPRRKPRRACGIRNDCFVYLASTIVTAANVGSRFDDR